MKVYISNKIFSMGGGSTVKDENGLDVYKITGKVFSLTRRKYLYDCNGEKLFMIRNRFFNYFVHKAYIYDMNGIIVATVKDKWINFNNEYFVEGDKDEIKIEGKFFSLHSEILKNGEVIGEINRQLKIIFDSFELIAEPKNIPFLIALVIAIDNICDRKYRS